MPETHSKESDIPPLSHIGSSVELHSSVEDSACNAHQNRPEAILSQAEFVTDALPESSLQGTSVDLQYSYSALTLLITG